MSPSDNEHLSELLHKAVFKGDIVRVQELLTAGADVNYQRCSAAGTKGDSALHTAACCHPAGLAELLVAAGADVNARCGDNSTPLLLAARNARNPSPETVRLLVAKGADVNAQRANGTSPLHMAVYAENLGRVKILLDAGSNPNLFTRDGCTPLHRVALRGGTEILDALLAAGADPNIGDVNRRTPLHVAATEDRVEIARHLLDGGAAIEARDDEGKTPLYAATSHHSVGVAGLLRLRGADRAFDLGDTDDCAVGLVCAMNALLHGCPALFFRVGGGHYVSATDEETGLPIWQAGQYITRRLARLVDGHNDGVREFIRLHGLPWNSRKAWLQHIFHPGEYFQMQPLIELEADGPEITAPDGKTVLRLCDRDHEDWSDSPKMLIQSLKLWPGGERPNVEDYAKYQFNPPAPDLKLPTLGHVWSAEPSTREVRFLELQFLREARVVWGPAGSELAFIKAPIPKKKYDDPGERIFVLDLQLGHWLSSNPGGGWRERAKD